MTGDKLNSGYRYCLCAGCAKYAGRDKKRYIKKQRRREIRRANKKFDY